MAPELPPLSEADRALIDAVASRVVEWRMEVPAVLVLESVKPLSLVGSQSLFFFEPIVLSIFHWPGYRRFAELIEHREHVETLIAAIEEHARRRRSGSHAVAGPAGRPPPRP
jgi:hypothetical protein